MPVIDILAIFLSCMCLWYISLTCRHAFPIYHLVLISYNANQCVHVTAMQTYLCYSITDRTVRGSNSGGVEIFRTRPGAHSASYTTGTGSFPGVKRPGRGVNHPPPYNAEVEERVELYFYSPSGPIWPVLGRMVAFLHSANKLPQQPFNVFLPSVIMCGKFNGTHVALVLLYQSEGRGIDPQWCRWGFFPQLLTEPCALGSTQPLKMSTRILLGVKTAGA